MRDIRIIVAPSILGLKPSGVEELAGALLANGLAEALQVQLPVKEIPNLNFSYSGKRDPETNCLNASAIRDFSLDVSEVISETMMMERFALVLGGDCSILIGIMAALKNLGNYGLVFLDAHADFYEPEQSLTGEVADMDLAIVTGRGPSLLTDIEGLKPYVRDENVMHVGQRDQEEASHFGAPDIRNTSIKCISLAEIQSKGIPFIWSEIEHQLHQATAKHFWIHFDTDVLSDDINPAVDYRLPGGLSFDQVETLLVNLLATNKIIGMSIGIYNPRLDPDGSIAKNLVESLGKSFAPVI